MRKFRGFVVFVILAFLVLVFQPYSGPLFAGHQSQFFRSNAQGGFQPDGVDFGFRLGGGAVDEARMFVTRPLIGNPRMVRRRDASDNGFTTFAPLPNRLLNNVPFIDSIAVIPASLGLVEVGAGFTPNDVFVSQGLKVYRVFENGSALFKEIPTTGLAPISSCNSTDSDLLFDRWGTSQSGFSGRLILICGGSGFLEVWLIDADGGLTKIGPILRAFTGRADLTSPNFSTCGGCLALVADNQIALQQVITLITTAGVVDEIPFSATGVAASDGKHLVITVPTRVYQFQTGPNGGCLFGTVPAENSIKQFPCVPDPNGFGDTVFATVVGAPSASSGDLLIFTSSQHVIRVKWSDPEDRALVHSNAGRYYDLAFPTRRQVEIIVQQPAVPNENKGVQGQIVFYILSGPGFNPQEDVDIDTIRFGRTGSEPSVNGNCNKKVGSDAGGDPQPDLKCFADPVVAKCGDGVACIVTGFTDNPTAFEGD